MEGQRYRNRISQLRSELERRQIIPGNYAESSAYKRSESKTVRDSPLLRASINLVSKQSLIRDEPDDANGNVRQRPDLARKESPFSENGLGQSGSSSIIKSNSSVGRETLSIRPRILPGEAPAAHPRRLRRMRKRIVDVERKEQPPGV